MVSWISDPLEVILEGHAAAELRLALRREVIKLAGRDRPGARNWNRGGMGRVTATSAAADEPASQPGYARVRDLIRADVIEGRLPSGSRLKIADLATRYASSGIPVREALQQLQGEGIVTFEPNRGARVRQLDEAFLRNIHEIRALVEPYLVRWFARHRSDAQIAQLESLQRAYDEAVTASRPGQWSEINQNFHGVCYDGHYNDEALAVARRHSDLIQAIANRFPATPMRGAEASREHWAIIAAVRDQNEDRAAEIIALHVRNAGHHLIERILAAGRADRRRPLPRDRRDRAALAAIEPALAEG